MGTNSKPEIPLSLADGLESLADLTEDEVAHIMKGFHHVRDNVKDNLPTLSQTGRRW